MAGESEASGLKKNEKRRHMRFKDPDRGAIQLSWRHSDGAEIRRSALIFNESLQGIACVFVGEPHLKQDDLITWHESDRIRTACRVVRCEKLHEDVYFLALYLGSIKAR